MRRSSDQSSILLGGVQLPQYTPHGEVYHGCHPGFNAGIVMRPAISHMEKEQPYPASLHSLSPREAEALYNCMDPKLWTDSTLNPMLLPPMFDSYYNGLDFHAPGYRKNVTKETTGPLKAWLQDHRKNPYPTKAEKIMLAIITKMTLTQVSTWFANARRRLKKETGRSCPDEEEEGRALSDEEGESGDMSHSKHGSDNEDECEEISVDDDGEEDVDEDFYGLLPAGPNVDVRDPATNYQLSPASCCVMGQLTKTKDNSVTTQQSGDQSCGRSTCSTAKTSTATDRVSNPQQLSRTKATFCSSEFEARPVDLSRGGNVRASVVQQQQHHPLSCVSSAANNTSPNHTDNSPTPKAKIWSISNILSMDSTKKDT